MVDSCVVTSAPTGILLLLSIGEIRHLCVSYFLSSMKEFTDTEANREKLYLEEEVFERAKQMHWGAAGQQTSSEELGCFLLWPRDVKREVPSGNHQIVFTFLIIKLYN